MKFNWFLHNFNIWVNTDNTTQSLIYPLELISILVKALQWQTFVDSIREELNLIDFWDRFPSWISNSLFYISSATTNVCRVSYKRASRWLKSEKVGMLPMAPVEPYCIFPHSKFNIQILFTVRKNITSKCTWTWHKSLLFFHHSIIFLLFNSIILLSDSIKIIFQINKTFHLADRRLKISGKFYVSSFMMETIIRDISTLFIH